TSVVWHPACRLHDPGAGHPERPARLTAVLDALHAPAMASVIRWCEARPASREELERVHPGPYLDALERLGRQGGGVLDPDTVMGSESWDAALAAAGPSLRYVSIHQYPWYPGTGREDERGVGNVFNVPRPPGLPREIYVRDLIGAVDSALEAWRPDLLLVSAGYDSLSGDPLG